MTPQELYVRRLRDRIYGSEPKFRTDANWEHVRNNWMKPENVKWLEAQPQNQQQPESNK